MVIKQVIGYVLLTAFIGYLLIQLFTSLQTVRDGELIGALIIVVILLLTFIIVKIVRD